VNRAAAAAAIALAAGFVLWLGVFVFDAVVAIDEARANVRACNEATWDAYSAVLWAKYEIEMLRGLKPGRPKFPQRQYEGHAL
jgi:hypothetical protein